LIAQKLKDFLNFIDINYFLTRACDGPELQKTEYKWDTKSSLFLNIDLTAVLKLSVESRKILYFV